VSQTTGTTFASAYYGLALGVVLCATIQAAAPKRPADREERIDDWRVAVWLTDGTETRVVGVATEGTRIIAGGCEGGTTYNEMESGSTFSSHANGAEAVRLWRALASEGFVAGTDEMIQRIGSACNWAAGEGQPDGRGFGEQSPNADIAVLMESMRNIAADKLAIERRIDRITPRLKQLEAYAKDELVLAGAEILVMVDKADGLIKEVRRITTEMEQNGVQWAENNAETLAPKFRDIDRRWAEVFGQLGHSVSRLEGLLGIGAEE